MVNKNLPQNRKYFTAPEVAEILGISRVAVFKKIKKGLIKATRIGRNYAISRSELGVALGTELTNKQKGIIEEAVLKVVKDYRGTLSLLGNE